MGTGVFLHVGRLLYLVDRLEAEERLPEVLRFRLQHQNTTYASRAGERVTIHHADCLYATAARDRGFDYAHIWVAPPQAGEDYIFHHRPLDPRHGTRPMSMSKLREWYERMLDTAVRDGVVATYDDNQSHVEHITSIREFPLFEGDFFPDHLKAMLEPAPAASRPGPPRIVRRFTIGAAPTAAV